VIVESGRFLAERVGRRSFHPTIADRKRTFISMPLGELWAVRRSTGVANVIGGAAVPTMERILLQSGTLGLITRSEKIRNWLARNLAQDSVGGTSTFQSIVWARAEDREGRAAEAILNMGEGYQCSAEAAVRAAERVAADLPFCALNARPILRQGFAAGVPSTHLFEVAVAHRSNTIVDRQMDVKPASRTGLTRITCGLLLDDEQTGHYPVPP
jgi:hypothetical protein